MSGSVLGKSFPTAEDFGRVKGWVCIHQPAAVLAEPDAIADVASLFRGKRRVKSRPTGRSGGYVGGNANDRYLGFSLIWAACWSQALGA